MTSTPDAPADPVGRLDVVRTLSEQLPRFLRVAHALKAQFASDGRDRAALVLLFPIDRLGPLRQGALAELVHADPSTISRHVAALVEQGLVQRVPDETDGRASRLVVTDAGRAALQDLRRERESRLDTVTAGWDAADLARFTRLFGRLIDDLETELTGAAGPAATSSTPSAPRRTR